MQSRHRMLGLALAATLLATAWLAFESDPLEGPATGNRKGVGPRGATDGGYARARSARRPQDEPLVVPNADALVREPFGTATANLFASHNWQPPPATPAPPVASPPPKAMAPPLPFHFLGRLVDSGKTVVFLGVGERTLHARIGDMVDGRYRIESVDADNIVFLYQPLNERQSLQIGRTP